MRSIVALVMVAAFCLPLVGGCSKLPDGIRMSLITAELSLSVTAADAAKAEVAPWKADPNETPVQTIERLRTGQGQLLDIMTQADKNLLEVIRWSESSTEGIPNE